MKKQSWRKIARNVFGKKATLNIGDGSNGRFALETRCRQQIDNSLWAFTQRNLVVHISPYAPSRSRTGLLP